MTFKKLFSTVLITLLFIGNIFAQDLISAADFVKLQKENKDLVLIDASKDKLYTQNHIEGAVSIPYAILNIEKGTGIEGALLPVEDVAKILGEKGVSNDASIVVYDEGSQKYSTRVYWILKYLGAKDVKLLHKDMSAFSKARVKLTAAVPSVEAKNFTVTVNPNIFADATYVASIIGNSEVVLIDARPADEYNGVMNDKNKYSTGHIEGAINIPYESTVEGDAHTFISPEAFKVLAPDVDLSPEKMYVVYCKTGVKGATMYAYLYNIMGFKNVKMYEGSYAEWDALGKPSVK